MNTMTFVITDRVRHEPFAGGPSVTRDLPDPLDCDGAAELVERAVRTADNAEDGLVRGPIVKPAAMRPLWTSRNRHSVRPR